VWSVYLYLRSRDASLMRAEGGNSGAHRACGDPPGNFLYDFFIGSELNPRVLGGLLDLKYFNELRPGLIGWFAINLGMLAHAYENDRVSLSLVFVVLSQGYYVIDACDCDCAITLQAAERARDRQHDGHHHGWIRLHAPVWRHRLGSGHVLAAGALPR
jgi:hypothetical protein